MHLVGSGTLLREVTWRAQLRGVQVLSIRCEAGEGPVLRLREGAEVLSGAPVDPTVPDAHSAALRCASANGLCSGRRCPPGRDASNGTPRIRRNPSMGW